MAKMKTKLHFGRDFRKFVTSSVAPAMVQTVAENPYKTFENEGMHYYLRGVFTVATFAGVFPVSNIYRKRVSRLYFSWTSFPTISSLVILTGILAIEVASLDYTVRNFNEDSLTSKGGVKKATSGSIFYGNAFVCLWLFISLAIRWPKLVLRWKSVEISMLEFGTPRIGCKVFTLSILLLGLAAVEHGLHNWLNARPGGKDHIIAMSDANGNRSFVIDQSPTFFGYVERFSFTTHWYLFRHPSDYNPIKGCIIMFLSIVATFLWNFTDLFIVLVSYALAAQFRLLTNALKKVRPRILTSREWRKYRETYTLLSHLVKNVNKHINSITAVSIGSNVYFTCAQLITEIDSIHDSYARTLFYMYSFFFLVFRLTAVVLQAAAINEESKKIAPELFLCPPCSFTSETQRFLQEVTSDYVALTGLNMFTITRNFLLGVAGAILTYEIVIIQLQSKNH